MLLNQVKLPLSLWCPCETCPTTRTQSTLTVSDPAHLHQVPKPPCTSPTDYNLLPESLADVCLTQGLPVDVD